MGTNAVGKAGRPPAGACPAFGPGRSRDVIRHADGGEGGPPSAKLLKSLAGDHLEKARHDAARCNGPPGRRRFLIETTIDRELRGVPGAGMHRYNSGVGGAAGQRPKAAFAERPPSATAGPPDPVYPLSNRQPASTLVDEVSSDCRDGAGRGRCIRNGLSPRPGNQE